MLTALQRRLVDGWQRDLPLVSRPYAAMADVLGVSEAEVIDALAELGAGGMLSRVGIAVAPNTAGSSTLAAMEVPPARLEAVAQLVNSFPEVNHNYEREHRLNLWFVVVAPDRARIDDVLHGIEEATGLTVLDLPLEQEFHIDLGFPIQWP